MAAQWAALMADWMDEPQAGLRVVHWADRSAAWMAARMVGQRVDRSAVCWVALKVA